MIRDAKYTLNPGQYLSFWIVGMMNEYIGEVITSDPLRVKVQESGPFANLHEDDIIIWEWETAVIQNGSQEETDALFAHHKERKRPYISGLKSLGVTDGELHEILPFSSARGGIC
jgi:hypothetical protein